MPEDRDTALHKEILLQLYGVRFAPKSPYQIWRESSKQGLDFTEQEIKRGCEFLSDPQQPLLYRVPASTGGSLYKIARLGVERWKEEFAA